MGGYATNDMRGHANKKKGAAQAAPLPSHMYSHAYQKNCRRASRMFGSSLTNARAVELYFLLSTIT